MQRVWKESLCVGRQRDRHGNWFTLTAKDIADAHTNATKMLKRKVPIPCVWEHQNIEASHAPAAADAVADWKLRYAKYTFGHLGGARINDRGNLDLACDVRDPKDIDQLGKTKFVSPKIYRGYADSKGGDYKGVTVAHLAATPSPVQSWQRPFELSKGQALYFSFAEDDVADDKKKEKPKKDDADKEVNDGEGEGGEFKKLVEALREVGLTIPDEVMDCAGLIIAIKAGGPVGGEGLGEEPTPPEEPPKTPSTTAGAAGSPPMLMSTTDPNVVRWSKGEKRDLRGRIKSLYQTGRIDRPTGAKLLREVDATELSYTDGGNLAPNSLVAKVQAYEELPKNFRWAKDGQRSVTELSNATELETPDHLNGKGETTEAGKVIARQEELAKRHSAVTK